MGLDGEWQVKSGEVRVMLFMMFIQTAAYAANTAAILYVGPAVSSYSMPTSSIDLRCRM